MASLASFDREIKLATAGLEPQAINAALAAFARQQVKAAIADGASANYDIYVNGHLATSEDGVIAPGPIVYQFSLWSEIIAFALAELQRRSPVRSGRFRNSFIVLVDGRIVDPTKAVPADSEIIITNFQPYIRKAEAGLLGTGRYAIFDGTKRALARRYGNQGRSAAGYLFETRWLTIGSGVHPQIPYVLKQSRGRRKSNRAGQPITYPSIVMNMVL